VIDILLPYWGDVDYFKLAVSSVLAQDAEDWRLVIVDDGYPSEEPQRWVEGLADPRIEYHRNQTNLGANANYRRALELAVAPLVVVMGADDVMRPNFITTVLAAAERHPEATVIQPGVEVIDGAGEVYLPLADRVKGWYAPRLGATGEQLLRGQVMARSLLRADWAYFPSLVWRTEAMRRLGFRPGLHVVQDLALLLDIAADGGSMLVLREVAFQYRRHSGSDSSVKAVNGARFDEERAFFADAAGRFAELGWTRAVRAARWHLTSRLNAATLLPTALRVGGGAPRALLRHIFG
jgi:glycosyltransferase involved in cell wall biosynthesis